MKDHPFPTAEQEDAAIAAFANLNLQVMITELGIDCSQGGHVLTGGNSSIRYDLPRTNSANQWAINCNGPLNGLQSP